MNDQVARPTSAAPSPIASAASAERPVRASAFVCEAVSCLSTGSHEVLTELGAQLARAGTTDIVVKRVGCLGLCADGPLVRIPETGRTFSHVRADAVQPIVEALAAVTPASPQVPQPVFFDRQIRIATENSGRIDPERHTSLAERLVDARHRLRETFQSNGMADLVEPFDPERRF